MLTTPKKQIDIEILYVDIESCRRCKGTDANLATALEMAQVLIDAAGAEVMVRKILVTSEQMAAELGFVSSPTIRVNGVDVDVDLRESRCEDCTNGAVATMRSLAACGGTKARIMKSRPCPYCLTR